MTADSPNPWASDPNVSDRQPAYCPYCGQTGSFDGQGFVGTNHPESRYRHHCPECGYEFITITEGE